MLISLCGVSEVAAAAVIIDFETLQVRPQLRSVASVGYGLTDYGTLTLRSPSLKERTNKINSR